VNKGGHETSTRGDRPQRNDFSERTDLSAADTAAANAAEHEPSPFLEAPTLDELVARARGGDKKAFEELVVSTYDKGYTVALHMLRRDADARDVMQEAFIRVQRGLKDFQGQAKFTTWLYRVVVNLCLDQLRHKKRWGQRDSEALETLENDSASPEAMTSDAEMAKVLEAGLATLPEIHRATFVLFEVEGLSYEEIAHSTGVRIGTVMSRLFYARKKMREFITEQEAGKP
jgi:RNA polymerase sigma-70 factor, ECF subfamily